MVLIDGYKYILVSDSKPANAQYFLEVSDGDLWLIDSSNNVKYSSDKGDNWTTKDTNQSSLFVYDQDNERVYWNVGQNIIQANALTGVLIDETWGLGMGETFVESHGVWREANSAIYVIGHVSDGNSYLRVEKFTSVASTTKVITDLGAASTLYISELIDDGTNIYFLIEYAAGAVILYKYVPDEVTITLLETCPSGTLLPPATQRAIAYDDSNNLYFILKHSGDSKYYLYTYDISNDILSLGAEQNIALMTQQHANGSNLEKAFHLTSYYAYQISKNVSPGQLWKIWDLNDCDTPPVNALIAISDNFIMDDGGKMFELTDMSSELFTANVISTVHSNNTARMTLDRVISTDVRIQLYDDNSKLAFEGKVGLPSFKPFGGGFLREYSMKGLSENDLKRKFTEEYSSQGIDNMVIDIIGKSIFTYIYTDATGTPNIATTASLNFIGTELRDALYVLAILGNAVWVVYPNGYLKFKAWGSLGTTSLTVTQATNNYSFPKISRVQQQVNLVTIYGSGDLVSSKKDLDHVQDYGPLEWNGKRDFPMVDSQAQLDLLAQAIIDWQGNQDNPIIATADLFGQDYEQSGETINITFDLRSEMDAATDYMIQRAITDLIKNKAKITTVNSLVY